MSPPRVCPNCRSELTFAGNRDFRTGGGGGAATFWLGPWAGASEELLRLAIWGCTTCGKIELFLPTADR